MTDSKILSRPRFEILPTRGAEELADYGFRVMPHIAARLVAGREHLEEIVRWLDEHGLRQRMLGPKKVRSEGASR